MKHNIERESMNNIHLNAIKVRYNTAVPTYISITHTYIHTYIHTHSHTHTYIHTNIHTCKHTYIHTQCTCIHA